uniref:Ig-like domain-containing protein n=1 Tax=Leptobrachium leishanense TaxID=445787 RepID=A0A8C5QAR9_9ANUR
MDSWESRQISVRDKDYPWRPEIQNIPVPGIISNRPARLECKISKFFPDNVTAKWLRKEKDSEELFPLNHGEKYKVPVLKPEKQSENTFTCTASLNFTPSLETDQGAEFICVVEHPSLGSAVEKKTGAVQVTEDQQKFIVNNIQGPQEWVDGEEVILYCSAFYCAKDVRVTWTINEKNRQVYEIPETVTQQSGQWDYVASRESTEGTEKEDKFHVTSSLKLTPSVQKHLGVTIKYNIVCEGKPTEKQFKVQSIHAKPTLAEPVKRTLCDPGDVKYSLNLKNFYPKDLGITWTCGTGQTQKPVTSNEQVQKNPLHTFNALSEVTVPGSHFKDPNFKVCVSWDHKTLKSPESREFSAKDPEFTWRPEMQEIPISQVLSGKEVTLQYKVSKYFPDTVTVKWLKKEKESQEFTPVNSDTKYKIPDLQHVKQQDHTYSCTARLVLSPSVKSEDGAEFICRVEHPSLEGAIEKRTEPLQVMAKPEISGPVKLTICETGEVLCVMNLRHFYPKDIDIQWICGSNQIKSEKKYENNPDLTFNVVSECRVGESFFRNQDCNIRATWKHKSMENQEVLEVSIKDPANHLNVHSVKRSLTVDDDDYDRSAGSFSKKKVRADMTVDQVDDEMEFPEENPTDKEVNDMDLSCKDQ